MSTRRIIWSPLTLWNCDLKQRRLWMRQAKTEWFHLTRHLFNLELFNSPEEELIWAHFISRHIAKQHNWNN